MLSKAHGWLGVSVLSGALVWTLGCSSDVQENASAAGSPTSNGSATSSSGAGANTSSSTGAGASGGGGGSGGTGAAPMGEVRLIAIGDTGEGNPDQHCVADAMNTKCGADGCDAVLLAGDNFYKPSPDNGGVTSTSDPIWVDNFELPYDRQNLNTLKFYAVLGNHDYSPPPLDTLLGTTGEKQAQIDYSTLPVGTNPGQRLSDKWLMPAAYFDVQFGNGLVHLFGVDTQDSSDTQLNDMSQRVISSTATWKLAYAHHPRFTSGNHAVDMPLLNTITGLSGPSMYELMQGIYCSADIYLCGHDHNREYISAGQDPLCGSTHFIISGAGAKVRSSSSSTVQNSVYYDEDIEGFFYLIFTPTEITVESYDMDPNDCSGAGSAQPAFTTTITK